jgi:hypothetical protein
LKSRPSDSRNSSRSQQENRARPSTVVPHPHRASLNKLAVTVRILIQSRLAAHPVPTGNTFSRPDGILAIHAMPLDAIEGEMILSELAGQVEKPASGGRDQRLWR